MNDSRNDLARDSLQPWLAERVARWQAFMAGPQPGRIMVNLATWDMDLPLDVPDRPLESWEFPRDCEAFAEHQARRLRAEWRLTREIDDDRLPFLNPMIGIAMNSLYVADGEMHVASGTTWRAPVIREWDDLGRLRLDEHNRWWQAIRAMNRRFLALNEGDYCVQTFSHFGPMDMANALRGNELFTDFHDAPEQVGRVLAFSAEAIWQLEASQRALVPRIAGGTVIWGTWVPGEAIFMSEDASDLCSPDLYRTFGQPAASRVSTAAGGCWIHHHAKGFQVHEPIARVSGLRVVEISWDPNCPRPVDRLEQLFEQNQGVPLMTRCTAKDVYALADVLRRGPLILMLTAESLAEAREAIKFLRTEANQTLENT